MLGAKSRMTAKQVRPTSRADLSPREIQARIRSGQTPEEVAEQADLGRAGRRFAGPILHEREYIAQEAAKVSVGRDDHGAVMLLGELVGSTPRAARRPP